MAKKPQAPYRIADNKKAAYNYFFEERHEAGMVLHGWEVKALREGKVQLTDGYVLIRDGELYLLGCLIHPLKTASTHVNPESARTKKLLLKKDEIKRQATRRSRDVLDRALNSAASIYRDIAVLQNNAEDAVGLINLENRSAITELSVRLDRTGAVRRLEDIATARRRLNGNGNPVLVFEALFCALIP